MKNRLKNIIKAVASKLQNYINLRDYNNSKYIGMNERSIEYSYVLNKITEMRPRLILDVGTGKSALPAIMRNCGPLVTAIDNIKDYWSNGMSNKHYHVKDIDILNPKLNNKYDMITCVSVLEHINNHEQAVINMSNQLNSAGVLIFTLPFSSEKYIANVYKLQESWAINESYPFITQSFSQVELEKWLKVANLELIDIEYWRLTDGKYWTCGQLLEFPKKSNQFETHQIACITLRRNR